MSLLRPVNDDKKIILKNIFFHYIYFSKDKILILSKYFFLKYLLIHIFYYIYYSPLFIISEPILSICLSNASSAFFPILENLPLSQFHILLHPLTFTRGCS